tara:strand:- start:10304 stop:10567 length:264 start_codon:yes stop_codon:yes gene_type:complete
MNDQAVAWWQDPTVWVGLLQGVAIWSIMVLNLGFAVAWISFACGGLIGFFLWLVAIGYGDKRFARATLVGILINMALASASATVAFL